LLTHDNEPSTALVGGYCFFGTDSHCDDGQICCRHYQYTGIIGTCGYCCEHSDCTANIDLNENQPPAGEFGKPFCVNNQCSAYKNGLSSQIPPDGYPVWLTSETEDNSKTFRKVNMPRTVHDEGPVMEQVRRIDFSQQGETFDKNNRFKFNDTHITIPSFDYVHASYSKSYYHYDEHETGVVNLVMIDNPYSQISPYSELAFVEKYHTLTYDGKIDTKRGDDIKKRAQEQLEKHPKFRRNKWVRHAAAKLGYAVVYTKTVMRQIEAGIDQVLAWQVRRHVNSYRENDVGSVHKSSSASWARHSKRAKQAIIHAKDRTFERDFVKSEQHCKHFEKLDGISFTEDTVTFPLGRPVTTFSAEMVNSPVHYLGTAVGHVTLQYDENTEILEIFFQTFSYGRQYSDPKYPGPYPSGLHVAPVANGRDYIVDRDSDGRHDFRFLPKAPGPNPAVNKDEADFTQWARPTEEVCDGFYLEDSFWEDICPDKLLNYNDVYELLTQFKPLLNSVIGGMLCSGSWMRSDYGGGTNGMDVQELGVWIHGLIEIRNDYTKAMMLTPFWDDWKCFYANECVTPYNEN